MFPADLLELLCCPASHQTLTPATVQQLARLNEAIADGRLHNAAGSLVREPLAAALVRADGAVAYPVRDGIPVLLVDEAVTIS